MNYTTIQETLEQVDLSQEIEALSVYRAFEHIQDGRHKRGVRYSIALILTLIVLGKLAGMTTLAGIAQWARRLSGVAERGVTKHPQELSLRSDRKPMCYERWMPSK